jgi:Domain of unknown function (DU1801)
MRRLRFADPAVAATFKAYPPLERRMLLELRQLILDTAKNTAGTGKLTEALRWGQPSYLTLETGSGSTIRLGTAKDAGKIALYFHCQSGLIDTFRQLYEGQLTFAGKRCIMFDTAGELPAKIVTHCVALALTHHIRKKKSYGGSTFHHHRYRSRPG